MIKCIKKIYVHFTTEKKRAGYYNMSDTTDWIKHNLPEINDGQVRMLVSHIKQLRVKEVDDFADYLSDIEDESAFEYGYGEYSYKRIREIDAE